MSENNISVTNSVQEIDYDLVRTRLRQVREQLDIPLKQAGEETKIGPQYLGQLELNRTLNVWRHLLALSSYYGTTADYLLGAEWAKTSERNPQLAMSDEALAAVRLIDSLPHKASRQELVQILEFVSLTIHRLTDTLSENIRLRLLLQELTTDTRLDEINVAESTVAQMLDEILRRNRIKDT